MKKKILEDFIKKNNMKNIIYLIIILFLFSCDNEIIKDYNYIKNKYSAIEIIENDSIVSLDEVSIDEAENILCDIVTHNREVEFYHKTNDNHIIIKHVINNSHNFIIDLNICRFINDNKVYYNGYKCYSTSKNVYLFSNNFSLSSTNELYLYEFFIKGFLVLKINDNGFRYIKIPIYFNGIYRTDNDNASFKYYL